ncbi:hypothetical protein MLD38_018734 [Melastoma candidum]|uniref:Uncharacterized protein n=1 Tax=Melastoma candidum TaxID=119954 RepID=A0ACB9QWM4_9MYRT|nr:hypothetical protein MLD38_018734 [Melastoma candidum]
MVKSRLAFLLNQRLTLKQSRQAHAAILVNNLTNLESLLIHNIVNFASCYSFSLYQYVESILSHNRDPDAFSWGCTVRFLSRNGQFKDACVLYSKMCRQGFCPNSFAVTSVLRSCARNADRIGGSLVHAQVQKYGFCGCVYVQTGMLDFYCRVGEMDLARKVFEDMPEKNVVSWNSLLFGHLNVGDIDGGRKVFDEIPEKDVVSWNSMVSGYVKCGEMEKAVVLFRQMPRPNSASWNTLLSGYVDSRRIKLAREIFDAMPAKTCVSFMTMIAAYSKCGDVESARAIFNQCSERNVLVYNAMIACYAQNDCPSEAVELFYHMISPEGNVLPDKITFSSVLSACSHLGDLKVGARIQLQMEKLGIEKDDHLTTAMIDLYAKCGNVEEAYKLFDSLTRKDVVAYTAMILGCGMNGRASDAMRFFQDMVDASIQPNLATFTGLLSACSHAGLVKEGYKYFSSMEKYGLMPSVDHYGVMVDLLGRAGHLEEAYDIVRMMKVQPNAGVWGALLLACRLHNNVEIGEIAANHCFQLEPGKAGYNSLLANVYASVGRWSDVKETRDLMREKGLAKLPGFSQVHSS